MLNLRTSITENLKRAATAVSAWLPVTAARHAREVAAAKADADELRPILEAFQRMNATGVALPITPGGVERFVEGLQEQLAAFQERAAENQREADSLRNAMNRIGHSLRWLSRLPAVDVLTVDRLAVIDVENAIQRGILYRRKTDGVWEQCNATGWEYGVFAEAPPASTDGSAKAV